MDVDQEKEGEYRRTSMGRYLEASCKICRRNREKLYLKGARCESAKCAIEKRNYPPGIRSVVTRKTSEYGRRLREKQKLRFFYSVSETQMRIYFKKALQLKGIAGHNLLSLFERRLDNVLFRAKVAKSRKDARQLIRHGHFSVNGGKVNITSYTLKAGDVVALRVAEGDGFMLTRLEGVKEKTLPSWLSYDEKEKSVKVLHIPTRDEIDIPVEEQLIVEFYSM